MIPEKAQGKVLEATVVCTGPGSRDHVSSISDKIIFLKTFGFIVGRQNDSYANQSWR